MAHFNISRKSPKTSQKNPTSFDQGTPEEYSGKHKPSVATSSPAGHRLNSSLTQELLSDSPTARKSLEMSDRSQHSLENPRFKPFNHLSSPNPSTRVRTPEISSVRSKRGSSPVRPIKMPFVSKARDSEPDSDSNSNSNNHEVQRVQNQSRNHSVTALNDNANDRFSPIDPAAVPVLLDKHPESPIKLESSTPNKEAPDVENLNPVELEEHLANEKSTTDANLSTGSGFISSMLSAAHNAASHIISPKPHTDIKSHPKSEETEALTTQGSSTTFVQHLDSIFFGPGKKQSNAAEADEDYEHEDDGEYFDHLSIATVDSSATKSNVRGINFEPVRKTNISTMGKGELRLEDLEFPSDQQQQLHPIARVISPVGTNFSRVLSDSRINSSPNIPSLSVTSDDGALGVDAQRVSQESASLSPIIGEQQQSYQPVGNGGRTTQFGNIPSFPSRSMSAHRQESLRPNAMPLQSLELFNGSKSFTEGASTIANGGHVSYHSSRNSSRGPSRGTSPVPSSGATNGLRGRAKSLSSPVMPPNTSSTATTHGSRPISYHFQNSLHPPRLSATFEGDSQRHNNDLYSGQLSIASRSSSMARFPISNGDGGGENGGVDSFELKNVHYATAKRDSDFHNIFRKLPQTDRLIDDFACALQKDILVQGRLYLSSRHISFKANILGWVTNVIIPLKEIVRLEKRNTAGVFPNAIAIQTLHAKHTFSSFLSRDSTFELITNIWNQLIRGGDIGDEEFVRGVSGFNSEYSDYSEEDDDGEVREEMIDQNDEDRDFDDGRDGDTLDSTDADEDEPQTPTGSADDAGESMGPLKHAPTAIIRDPQPNETKIIDRTIDAPLGKVYNVLFGDDTSKLRIIIERQGNKDISPIPAFTMDDSIRKRSYEYTKPLNSSVGPKQTLCQVSEAVDNFDFNSFVLVTQSTKNPDVPSGGVFVVITQIYLSWAENNKTKLQIFSFVVWNAKSWLKGPIESGTISGQKEALGVLTDELVKLLNSGGRARSKSSLTTSDEDEQEGVCTLPTMGPKTHTETENEYKQKPADVFITEETFDVPLGTLYSVLFGDDTSYIAQIIKAQKNREISEIAKFDKTDVGGKRTYNYVKPLSAPVGPKQTKCIITESIEQFNLEKSITVLQSTQTPDVPSGNAFTTNTKFYLSWGKNNSTKMYVVTFMSWTGKSWLKGPIEKGAIDGQKESIKILVDEVKTIIANNTTGKKRKKGKKGKKGKEEEENGTNGKRSTLREEFLKDGKQYQINSLGILPNVSFLALFLLITTLLLVRFMGLGSIPSQSSSVTDINHVQINGQDYILMPLVSDLTSNQQLRNNAEFEIWEWINERSKSSPTAVNSTDQQSSADTTTHDLKSDDYVKKTNVNGKEYEDQQLKDMIKIVEGQLSTLKKQLGKQDQGGDTMDAGVVVDEKETKLEDNETSSVESL